MLYQGLMVASLSIAMAAGSAAGQCCGGGQGADGHAGHNHGGSAGSGGHVHEASGQGSAGGQRGEGKGAVNAICPIGKEPIDGRTFINHEGDVVGFCCPGCEGAFMDWSQDRREGFIAGAKAGPAEPEPARPAAPSGADGKVALAALYPLDTCPITGQKLGSMGDPAIEMVEGREVRFCCPPCLPRFEQNLERQMSRLDARIIEMQLPYYAMETCPVSGSRLGSMGEPDNYVYQNRLVRFCCAACRDGFNEDPAKHIAALDKAAADDQRAAYPLDRCVVRGNRLGSMGDPAEVILAGRLVRLCCPPCEGELRKNPAEYIAKLDEAWRDAGRPGVPVPAER